MTQYVATAESKQRTAALLTDLWQRSLPTIEQRMAALERASTAAAAGSLNDDFRADASNVAHKLAGSLGMFGFERGTEIARDLELILDSPSPDANRLASLIAQLRSILLPKS